MVSIVSDAVEEPQGTPIDLNDLFEDLVDVEAPAAKEFQRGGGAEIDLDSLFETIREPSPTLNERFEAIGQGATAGAAQGIPTVAGAVAGAVVGGEIGLLGGPFAPVTVPAGLLIGGTIGLVSGMMAGEEIQKQLSRVSIPGTDTPLTYDNIESVPLNLRPYAIGGEVMGLSVGFVALPYRAAAKSIEFAPNLPGRLINNMTRSAGEMPVRFAMAEASAAFGSGVGGGIAEANFPGEFGPRITGEVVGGVLNPARYLISMSRGAFTTVKRVVNSRSATGQENRAVVFLQDVLAKHGEDPGQLALAIREGLEEFPELNLTVGRLTNNKTLMAIENKLLEGSSEFGQESRKMAQESLETLRSVIGLLETTGDPVLFRAAAQMRRDYFTGLLATRLHIAEQKMLEAASKIDPASPTSGADYGISAGRIIKDALEEVRKTETSFWNKIPNLDSEGSATIGRFNELKGELLEEQTLPSAENFDYQAFIRRISGEVDDEAGDLLDDPLRLLINFRLAEEAAEEIGTTTAELVKFRSAMLTAAREASANNKFTAARVFGELAESARDDLDAAFDGSPEYEIARDFSAELHDTFSRTFAGATQQTQRSGAKRIPPEVIMNRAFGTGREMGDLHFSQLEAAARMAGGEHVSRLLDIQEKTIRFAAKEILNPATKRADPDRLVKFLKDNAALLKRFPEIADALKNTRTAEIFLRATEAGNKAADRAIKKRAAFSSVLAFEDPTQAVRSALKSRFPEREFAIMARLANRGGVEAVDGFRASIFNHAYIKATGSGDTFSFNIYRESFESPINSLGLTLKELMINNGVATRKQMDVMKRFLDRAVEIENTLKAGESLDELFSAQDAIVDFGLRVAGARASKLVPGEAGANQLIVAGAASRGARQIFDKIPKQQVKFFLIEAFKNPKIMEKMLLAAKTPAQKIRFATQMNAFLWQIGITTQGSQEEENTVQ